MNVFSYEQTDGWHHPPLASKMRGIKLTQGQSVKLETPGGGGYGPADQRSASAIQRDIDLGYLTRDQAAKAYGPNWQERSQ